MEIKDHWKKNALVDEKQYLSMYKESIENMDPLLTPLEGQTLCPMILRWSSSSLSATSKAIFSVPISMLATKWLPAIVFFKRFYKNFTKRI